jgi:type III polyketide synthase
MNLADDHIRASLEVYQSYGNSSSPTVLIVLDRLRHMGRGRDNVIATSFGPGMMIEMCMLKRCHDAEFAPHMKSSAGKKYNLWLSLHSRLVRLVKWHSTSSQYRGMKQGPSSIVL